MKRLFVWLLAVFVSITLVLAIGAWYSLSLQKNAPVSEQTEIKTEVPPETSAFTEAPFMPGASDVKEKVPIVTADDPSFGPSNAAVTVVEFSDFECPFCKQAYPIIRELMVKYGGPFDGAQGGRVRFVYRDFPVDSIHDYARKAAEAGECADDQGKFWQLHDRIFQNQERMTVEDLKRYARAAGLNGERFDFCLDNNQFANEVDADLKDGISLGVRGTPTWFINGRKVEGVIPRDKFVALLEALVR